MSERVHYPLFLDVVTHPVVSFLDAFSHLYKRVCPSVGPSVRRSVGHTRVEFPGKGLNLNKIVQEHETMPVDRQFRDRTRAVRENASVVRTLFDLFNIQPV